MHICGIKYDNVILYTFNFRGIAITRLSTTTEISIHTFIEINYNKHMFLTELIIIT